MQDLKTESRAAKLLAALFPAPLQTPHSGRSLAQHLLGTHRLLQEWSAQSCVRMAGLLHTAYGTATYRPHAPTWGERRRLWDIIGHEAEYLVYVYALKSTRRFFSALDKAVDRTDCRNPYVSCRKLSDSFVYSSLARTDRELIVVSKEQICAIANLLAANAIDQQPYVAAQDRKDTLQLLSFVRDLVLPQAQEMIARLLL
jgi:hypothetical protein